MSRKAKYTIEQKVKACHEYLSGSRSAIEIARELNMSKNGRTTIMEWAKKYQANGVEGMLPLSNNSRYTKDFKLQVVQVYQRGNISLRDLIIKFNISSKSTVRQWILKYNRQEELEEYLPNPEVYKMSAKKTTKEERIEIVNWCIEHQSNYKEAASQFKCSYTQVYNWVKKYKVDGEEGLTDRRGQCKIEEELSTKDKLKKENERLSQRTKELEREVELLKKLNAFNWMD